jgi:hypothetical protein
MQKTAISINLAKKKTAFLFRPIGLMQLETTFSHISNHATGEKRPEGGGTWKGQQLFREGQNKTRASSSEIGVLSSREKPSKRRAKNQKKHQRERGGGGEGFPPPLAPATGLFIPGERTELFSKRDLKTHLKLRMLLLLDKLSVASCKKQPFQ